MSDILEQISTTVIEGDLDEIIDPLIAHNQAEALKQVD